MTLMARADQKLIHMRIIIERSVVGVLHSRQEKDDLPLDPKSSSDGEPLIFNFRIRRQPGPKFFGDQVRREGPVRRFVYIRVGTYAGDPVSPRSRRMKIDIHEIGDELLGRVADGDGVIKTTVIAPARTVTPPAPPCGQRGGASSIEARRP